MVEQLKNNEGLNSDDLAKLQQDILASLEQHSEPEIVSDLEHIKNTLEDNSLSDQEKYTDIKDELQRLKEKGIIFDQLADLERKIEAIGSPTSATENTSNQLQLEQIASMPNSPQKDALISEIADKGRVVSADNVVQELTTMQKSGGVRGNIAKFFSSRI